MAGRPHLTLIRDSPVDHRSRWLLGLFGVYAQWYVVRHFNAVRVDREGAVPILGPGPVIVAMNQASWWDPLLGILLAARLGDRPSMVPLDASLLARRPLLRRVGFFGVESGTLRGWRSLVEVGEQVLARPGGALWLTPQERQGQARGELPVLRRGVGHLVQRMHRGTVLPLAVEYRFWRAKRPELLIRFGAPVDVADGRDHEPEHWTACIITALQETQEGLERSCRLQDPARFEAVLVRRNLGSALRFARGWFRRPTPPPAAPQRQRHQDRR